MTNMSFHAAMTKDELLDGEKRQHTIEQSRKLAMASGLTKSSNQLRDTWEKNPETCRTLLKGAIARLVSVIEQDDTQSELSDRCWEIALSQTANGDTT